MPDRQEEQGDHLGNSSAAEELQSLVDVDGNPVVGGDVEALYDVVELRGGLQPPDLDVSTATPVRCAVLSEASEGEAGDDTDGLRHEPGRQVLGQHCLEPERQQDQLGEQAAAGEMLSKSLDGFFSSSLFTYFFACLLYLFEIHFYLSQKKCKSLE